MPSINSEHKPQIEIERLEQTLHEPLWYVILHDDQEHSYDYVIKMLVDLFKITVEQAFLHAIEVDHSGFTICARLPKSKARDKRDQIMSYGGDPMLKTSISMRASIEPCDD